MKVATPRKNIKTDRDLKPPPTNGLKSAMVASRTSLKESFVTRSSAQRYAELPSLRYGASPTPTAAQMIGSGPLRVSTNFEGRKSNVLRCKRSSSYEGSASSVDGFSSYGTESRCNYENASEEAPPIVRRVRFAELPPKCNTFNESGDEKEKDDEGGEEDEEEGTENWMRNRVGIPCIDGNSVSQSARFARHAGLTTSASFPTSVKIENFRLGNGGAVQGGTVLTNPNARKHVPRGHDTSRYRRGTLTQISNPAGGPSPLLRAAKDGTEEELIEILRKAALHGISQDELNSSDASGRTAVSYIASSGSLPNLEAILQLQGIDVNKADNEGNTPLHFAAQAGQVEAVNYMLSRCTGLEVDARNALGFTPLMKAALQGRTKCAKLLLFAGASASLRDSGRGLRAEQWAKFCGRHVCAEVIEKFSKHRLLDKNVNYGRWGSESELAVRIFGGKLPLSTTNPTGSSTIKSKFRKAFRTSHSNQDSSGKAFSVVTQLTSAALCASSPVLPTGQSVPPSAKSLSRPLSVPKLQVTLAANSNCMDDSTESTNQHPEPTMKERTPTHRPTGRTKKKK